MGFTMRVFVATLCLVVSVFAVKSTALGFTCTTSGATCNSLIDYKSPNATTLAAVGNLFGVNNLRSILGANGLDPSTSQNLTVTVGQIIKIPFPCTCRNGTGISNGQPVYTVVRGDVLYHIARDVFAELVIFQDIKTVNNIPDANSIDVGQRLLIPLPCSCDDVGGQQVVHYGHVVAPGSTVGGIAQQYNTTESTLLTLNNLNSSLDLKANAILNVPLKACTSRVRNDSLDYPLLVPNGKYVYTATNCVRCQCDAASNWILQCQPSGINSSVWQSCPSVPCPGSNSLFLGNTTTTSNCNSTTCAYAGYNNQTILATTDQVDTCPASNAMKFGLRGWKWNFFVVVILLLLHLLQ